MNNNDENLSLPAFVGPHEGRELDLMRAGQKHLSKFVIGDGENVYFPESEFDQLVAQGFLIKDQQEKTFATSDGREIKTRDILYATVSESWRIPAMRLVENIYEERLPGWRPDLERVIGALLGYNSEHIELFIERTLSKS